MATVAQKKSRSLLGHQWRAPAAGAVGAMVGFAASRLGMLDGASALIGWDAAAVFFLVSVGWILLFDDECDLRERAAQEDEGRPVLTGLILACITFSFGAIIVAMREGKSGHGGGPLLSLLAIATLILSWLCVQSLFTLHYAHRYFGDSDRNGKTEEGFSITGDKPNTYRDFIYMAVCIGACFQVSDFGPTTTTFRNLVTVHALISFAFNTLVIALGVGIFGDLLKG